MTFSLSRCHVKKAPNRAMPAPSKARAKSSSSSSSARRRMRPFPPIPCYKAYSKLERMEEEFLRQDDKDLRAKRKMPIGPSRFTSSLPSFSSSEDDDDDALLDPVFSRSKKRDVDIHTKKPSSTPSKTAEDQKNRNAPSPEDAEPVSFHEAEESDTGETKPVAPVLQPENATVTIMSSATIQPRATSHSRSYEVSSDVCRDSESQNGAKMESAGPTPRDEDQPGHDDLQSVKAQIDAIFSTTDMQSSLKQFLAELEGQLGRLLTVKEKKVAKAYIKELVNQRTRHADQSSTGSQVITKTNEVHSSSTAQRKFQVSNDVVHIVKEKPASNPALIDTEKAPPVLSALGDTSDRQSKDTGTSFCKKLVEREPRTNSTINGCDVMRSESLSNSRAVINQRGGKQPTAAAIDPFEFGREGDDDKAHFSVLKEILPKRRKRGRSVIVDSSTEKENMPNRQDQYEESTSNIIKRKRARKGTCALCTTCPCSKSTDAMDKNGDVTFARSDPAVEKALIRRVQKMEKTCELNEGRLETVRRKLKQHRRDMRKKQEANKIISGEERCYRFLPDTSDFEVAAETESSQIPRDIVNHAQTVLFPDTPYVQVTLTQLMGGSKKSKGIDDGGATFPRKAGLPAIPEETDGNDVPTEHDDALPIFDAGEDKYIEYSKGVEYTDRIRRKQWKQASFHASNIGDDTFSLWQGLVATQNVEKVPSVPPSQNSIFFTQEQATPCSWDLLFHDDDSDNGIEQLVGLFDDTGTESDESSKNSADGHVHLSALSQTGRAKTTELISSIENDSERVVALERLCPNWRENLSFAMKQNDADEIKAALEKVRLKRAQMLEQKRRIVDAWERQDSVLELFEKGLNSSLGRLDVVSFEGLH